MAISAGQLSLSICYGFSYTHSLHAHVVFSLARSLCDSLPYRFAQFSSLAILSSHVVEMFVSVSGTECVLVHLMSGRVGFGSPSVRS